MDPADVEDAYDQLVAEFAPSDAQAALLAVAAGASSAALASSSSPPAFPSSSSVDALVDAALDWLCLNLDANSLPRRYAGALPDNAGMQVDGGDGERGGDGSRRKVKVLAANNKEEEARKLTAAGKEEDAEAAARKQAEAAALRAQQEAAAAAAARAAAEAAAREREEERGASKSYILKYLEQQGSSGDEDEDGDDDDDLDCDGFPSLTKAKAKAAAASNAAADGPGDDSSPLSNASSVIEDWEVWGDPREIERRKLERARAARPRAERVEQVVGEWGVVRAEAARAKASGDRGRQRAAGMAMASLKREAEELGIGQDELEGRKGGEGEEGSGDGGDSRSSSSSSDDDDDGAGMGLFNDEAGADAPQWEAPSAASRKPLNVDDILRPWGEAAALAAEGAKKKKGGGGGGGGGKASASASASAAASLAPKAVLQQLCSKKGIPPPRFDKLPPGGLRGEALLPEADATAATAGLLRYSVAVEPFSSSAAVSAAASKRGGGAKRRPPPPIVFTLDEADDGWSAIQEAQNAAATLALYRLTGCGGNGGSGDAKGGGGNGSSGRQRRRAPATSVAAASREVMTAEGASALALLDPKSPYAALFLSWVARDSGLLEQQDSAAEAAAAADGEEGSGASDGNGTAPLTTSAEADRASFVRSVVAARAAAIAASRKKGTAAADAAAADDGEEQAAGTRNQKHHQRRHPSSPSPSSSTTTTTATELESQRMLRDLEAFDSSPEGRDWARQRSLLPVCEIRQPLLEALARNDVVVVGGDTGCGKTTQVPQYLLEAETRALRGGATSIVCTQPRRLAAVSVAERVSQERGERGGPGARGNRVGYHVRLDASYTRDTRLLFCTTGILLRKLGGGGNELGEDGEEEEEEASPSSSSLDLSGVSHVVVDEVHERSLQGDFLLAILRDVVARRRRTHEEAVLALARASGKGGDGGASPSAPAVPPPPLKVVLMSATLDSRLFASYFGSDTPCLRAGGRTFPVEHLFLEDAYARTGYRLASDARAALRLDAKAARRRQQDLATRVSSSAARLARDNWGDADADALAAAGALNKWYDPALYRGHEEFVRRNLERVDETAIDFDLIEELVDFIDATDVEEKQGDEEEEGNRGQNPHSSSLPSFSSSKTPVGTGGAVLIFLPGAAEIAAVCARLSSSEAARRGKRWVLPLHSSVSPADQRRAFQRPPRGVRKCVVATNIAETSITIDDVSFVIDSGKLKERRHDAARGMGLLIEDFVSRAAALQRKGRAGRTRPGVCFALYTRRRFCGNGGNGSGGGGGERNGENGDNDNNSHSSSSSQQPTSTSSSTISGGVLRDFQAPEMVRVPLEELVLQIHLLGLGPAGPFLSRVLEPPPARAVEAALESLRSVGALEALPVKRASDDGDDDDDDDDESEQQHSERLTPLGRHLAQLPVDARVGKLLLMGALLGVLSPALTIAACLSHKPPFLAQGPLGGGGGGRDQQQQSGSAADATVSAVKAALGAAPGSSSAAAALLQPLPAGKRQKPAALSSSTTATAPVPSIAAGQQSDHLVWAAAYEAWSSAVSAAARASEANKSSGGGGSGKGRGSSSSDAARAARAAGAAIASRLALSQQCLNTLQDMRGQFATMLADARFVDRARSSMSSAGGGGVSGGFSSSSAAWADDHAAPWNRHAREACVIKAALTAALYPNVAVLDEAAGEKGGGGGGATTTTTSSSSRPPLFHDGSGPVSIHPSSTLSSLPARALTSPYLVYLEKMRTTRAFLRDATAVSPMAVCLFGGSSGSSGGGGGGSRGGGLEVRHAERSLVVDGWLRARLPSAAAAVLVVRAREALDRYLASRVESRGGGRRGGNENENEKTEKSVIDAIVWLLREHAAVATTAKD